MSEIFFKNNILYSVFTSCIPPSSSIRCAVHRKKNVFHAVKLWNCDISSYSCYQAMKLCYLCMDLGAFVVRNSFHICIGNSVFACNFIFIWLVTADINYTTHESEKMSISQITQRIYQHSQSPDLWLHTLIHKYHDLPWTISLQLSSLSIFASLTLCLSLICLLC